jgi:hypothetical protein
MGAVDTPEAGVKHKKVGIRKRQPKRIGVKIDMTPMVDVAFLLLIFFMCTTVFRKPQALEINLPPDPKAKVEIAQQNVLTLRVIAGGQVEGRDPGVLDAGEGPLQGSETRPAGGDLRGGGEEEPEARRPREDGPPGQVQVHGGHHRSAPVRGVESVLLSAS